MNSCLDLVVRAAEELGPLLDELTLVGGCLTGILITDSAADPPRATYDVGLLVEALTLAEYDVFGSRLRAQGFQPDMTEQAPLCRWRSGEVLVDIVAPVRSVLGFSNRWYEPALPRRLAVELPGGRRLAHLAAPDFIATKIEAFRDRGENCFLSSHDIEDVIRVIDGRPALEDEMQRASQEVRSFVADCLRAALEDPYFLEALPGYFPQSGGAERADLVATRLRKLAGLLK